MGFNYAKEKRKFDIEWRKLRVLYREAGMEETAIQAMYDFDLAWFNSRRRYDNHTQPYPSESLGEGVASTLCRKFPTLVTYIDVSEPESWQEAASDDNGLFSKLKKLSDRDKTLLRLLLDGWKQHEIAKFCECSQANISKRIKRIKHFLK